jgi:LPXTG-motif cell wall-anchored protein
MVQVTIAINSVPTDTFPRNHGLAIDTPLNSDFWTSQPNLIINSTSGTNIFTYSTTVDLAVGNHQLTYGVSAFSGAYWTATISLNGAQAAQAVVDAYHFLTVNFNVTTSGVTPAPPGGSTAGIPNILIGLGILAAGAIGYYLYKKRKR